MPYVLGIHLGSTATSAAIAKRDGSRWGAAVPVPLGNGCPTVPTVLCKVQDGSFVAGEPARRQELTHHEWVVRAFARTVGDDAPMLVGSEFIAPQRLAATMVEWVADTVAHQQGHPPEHIAVAHSATWGPYRTHLMYQALSQLGLNDTTLLPEPLAVGLDYASKQRVEENGTIAVGNVGGSGFDATVLRRRHSGFEVVGRPLDSGHPSGQDLDDEVFGHLRSVLGDQFGDLDLSDVQNRAAVLQLRAECTRVKEALSYQPEAALRVELPQLRTEVSLGRGKYEQLVRPHLERVPELLLQAVQSANLTTEQLDAIVLAGGSVRAPLVNQLVGKRLEQQPQVDGAPELVAARGAALSAVELLSAGTDKSASAQDTSVLMRAKGKESGGYERIEGASEQPPVPRPEVEVEPMYIEPPDEQRQRMIKIIKLTVAALLIIGGLVFQIMHETSDSPSGQGGGGMFQQK